MFALEPSFAQFAAHEDFGNYPRTLEADLSLLRQMERVSIFHPSKDEMYRSGPLKSWWLESDQIEAGGKNSDRRIGKIECTTCVFAPASPVY